MQRLRIETLSYSVVSCVLFTSCTPIGLLPQQWEADMDVFIASYSVYCLASALEMALSKN